MSDLKSGRNCPACKEWKPAQDFRRSAKNPGGLSFCCRACFRARDAASYRIRRARSGFKVRPGVDVPEGHGHCPKCEEVKPHSEWHRHLRQPDGSAAACEVCLEVDGRAGHLERSCGLTGEDVRRMIAEQLGTCPIRVAAEPVHVDHDHATGRVRAVLCFNRNAALGMFKDRPDALRRAASYVEGIAWKPTLVAPGAYRLPS